MIDDINVDVYDGPAGAGEFWKLRVGSIRRMWNGMSNGCWIR